MTLIDKAVALHQRGNLVEAEALYKEVLNVEPNDFDALHMFGIICATRGAFQEAEKLLRKALSVDSRVAPCFYNYGTVLAKLNRFEDALSSYNSAIKLAPNHAPIYSDRGNVLFKLNRYEEALASYERTLSLSANFFDAWNGRGNALFKLKLYDEALGAYDKALALKPDLANAWLGRGNVFLQLKRYDEALAACDKAISLNADLAEAWLGRGNVFLQLKRYDDAFTACDRAFSLKPNIIFAEGMRLHAKMHLCYWNNFDAECEHLISSVRDGNANTPPFSFLAIPSSSEDQLLCAKLWVDNICPPSHKSIWQSERYNHDRICVAYVSADFRQHPVSHLIAGMLELHDRSRFDVRAISFGPDDNSEIRRRLKASFEHFVDGKTFSDEQVANLVRSSEVDILVDLMSFTTGSRTSIFASRPAPIQVNYLGYPGTMGANYIDYIIGDQTVIPDDSRRSYSEKIAILPNTYQVNDRKRSISEKAITRSDAGLPSKGFVFCCFNNNYKITPRVFDSWMRILKQVEGSVLWLLETNVAAANNLKKEAVARGVSSERLVFAKRMPLPEHLSRHKLADLFLDTLPYNAHTTASDALWAGLPVLTCLGETFAGRVAASLLNAISLPELITTTLDTYEQLAIDLATHPEKMATIRSKLTENRLTKPLFDTKRFTKHIEAAFTAMYERNQAGLAPDHIVIPN